MPELETTPNSQRSSGPPAGTPVVVDVFARTKADGTTEFSHEWRWQDGTPGGKGTIGIPAREPSEPGTPIHFHLRDETRPPKGLVFTEDSDGAMWVLRDSCPPEDRRCDDPQIPTDRIIRSPNLLRVFDENSEDCMLHYRLRFRDRSGKLQAYDPDITNGGNTGA